MSKNNCNCSCNPFSQCWVLAVAASVVIGIVTTLLTITAVITLTPAFLWVLFGIAVVYLAITLLSATSVRCSNRCFYCTRTPLSLLLAGILGTILTAVILLGITFPATSVLGAILAGVLLLFFSLLITSTVCFVRCLFGMEDDRDDDIYV